MTDLACKRALVAGGSQYMSAVLAVTLAERGADVVISYEGPADCAAEMIARVESLGRRGHAVQTDSSGPVEVKRMVDEAVAWLGGLDILVNNSGVAELTGLCAMTLEDIDLFLQAHMHSAVLTPLAAVPHIRAGGRIVMIGSNNAERPPDLVSALHATTNAVYYGFIQDLARELRPRDITVNLVRPRPVPRPIDADPDGRAAPPEHRDAVGDLAAVVAFVASPDAAGMTGSIITADGGFYG